MQVLQTFLPKEKIESIPFRNKLIGSSIRRTAEAAVFEEKLF
jgi:hypothetical protein